MSKWITFGTPVPSPSGKTLVCNPYFHGRGRSGLDSALRELNRLYDIEREYAVLIVRNGDFSRRSI